MLVILVTPFAAVLLVMRWRLSIRMGLIITSTSRLNLLMALPLLAYPLTTQNARVNSLSSDQNESEHSSLAPLGGSTDSLSSEIDRLINRSYRQIFFHALSFDKDPYLESQLRNGSITVRDFIRGLLLSRRFYEGYYQCSSNYRMVDQLVGRILGRSVHGDAERRSWSTVIADCGYEAFVDALLTSDEYMSAFGYDRVPQQRSRLLPGRDAGERPIYQSFPRYADDYRERYKVRAFGEFSPSTQRTYREGWDPLNAGPGIDNVSKRCPWTPFLEYQKECERMGKKATITEFINRSNWSKETSI